ncbi:hypothetical protein GIB67_023119 [Kingdonia uniflora]|uniref:HNH endonuclease 5 domain-containing protein n=1 Tax=Kingdonia uniflora TaxID=39325 RepID=A0A7J7M5W4_9MAGN|nr:hypothetical protein GIB67_023119 [Kingdonia uniflora]
MAQGIPQGGGLKLLSTAGGGGGDRVSLLFEHPYHCRFGGARSRIDSKRPNSISSSRIHSRSFGVEEQLGVGGDADSVGEEDEEFYYEEEFELEREDELSRLRGLVLDTSYRCSPSIRHIVTSRHLKCEKQPRLQWSEKEREKEMEREDGRPVNVVCWKRAICLEFMDKADVLEYYDRTVDSPGGSYYIPAVLRVPHLLQVVKRRRIRQQLSRKNIFFRDSFTCQYCSSRENLTIDHVLPISRGGEWIWENLEETGEE